MDRGEQYCIKSRQPFTRRKQKAYGYLFVVQLKLVFTEATRHPICLYCLGCTCLLFRLSLSAAVAQLSYTVAITFKWCEPDGKMEVGGRAAQQGDREVLRV